MTLESKSARRLESVLVGCGMFASLIVITSILLPQDSPGPFPWISLGFCILSLLAGLGYFILCGLVPIRSGWRPIIGTAKQTLIISRILAVLCNLVVLIAVLATP